VYESVRAEVKFELPSSPERGVYISSCINPRDDTRSFLGRWGLGRRAALSLLARLIIHTFVTERLVAVFAHAR